MRQREEIAKNRGRKRDEPHAILENLKPRRTARKKKMEVISYLHRHRLQHVTMDARSWVQHRTELKKELCSLNRRIIELWLEGEYKARELSSLATRIAGLRQRLMTYTMQAPSMLSLAWGAVTVDDMEQLELYLSSPKVCPMGARRGVRVEAERPGTQRRLKIVQKS